MTNQFNNFDCLIVICTDGRCALYQTVSTACQPFFTKIELQKQSGEKFVTLEEITNRKYLIGTNHGRLFILTFQNRRLTAKEIATSSFSVLDFFMTKETFTVRAACLLKGLNGNQKLKDYHKMTILYSNRIELWDIGPSTSKKNSTTFPCARK
eukprot:UN33786